MKKQILGSWKPGNASGPEVLESRIAPATISAFTFKDADGDLVKVSFSGSADSVVVKNSNGDDLSTGAEGDIDTFVIANPSADFRVTFSDTNPGSGGDVIALGNISGPDGVRLPIFGGINTIENSSATVFNLTSFIGTGFTSGGGLNIRGSLLDGPALLDLDLSTLGLGAKVAFRDGFAAGASGSIAGPVLGQFIAGNFEAGSKLTVLGVSNLLKVGNLDATASVTVETNVVGRMEIGLSPEIPDLDPLVGEVFIKGSIGKSGLVTGPGDMNLKVGVELRGTVQAYDDLTLTVGKNINGGTVVAGDNLAFTAGAVVGKSAILAGGEINVSSVTTDVNASSITGGSGLTLDVGGSVKAARLSGNTDTVDLEIKGSVVGSQIVGGGDVLVDVDVDVIGSKITSDSDLIVTVTGSVGKSQIASNSAGVNLTVGGKVVASRILAADSASVTASDEFNASSVTAGQDITANLSKNVIKAEFIAGSNLDFTGGGSVVSSALLPRNDLSVTVTGDMLGSQLETGDSDARIGVSGKIAKTAIRSGDSLLISESASIAADVQMQAATDADITSAGAIAGKITAAGTISVTAGGVFSGTMRSGQDASLTAASVVIGGSLPSKPLSPTALGAAAPKNGIWSAGNLWLDVTGALFAPVINVGGDVTGFHVGGDLRATVRVGGDFGSGASTDTSATVVAGKVLDKSWFEIGGNLGGEVTVGGTDIDTAPKLVFGGEVLGRINVGGKLLTDLQFAGGVAALTFDGPVGPTTAGDGIANIVAAGVIKVLSSGSVFTANPGGGNFTDGADAVTGIVTGTILTVL